MIVPEKIIDQPLVLTITLCSFTIGNPGRLYNPGIVTNIINQPYKTLIQNFNLFIQKLFSLCSNTMSHLSPPFF
jgi:hypothetical protein